ncbi:MAG: pyridoxamine 5'-phosphate oxidase family protein [Bacillota bacterium]|nr:pyridoxamine 5'-phosphate oxidase family protein [Bacillota bacterium]
MSEVLTESIKYIEQSKVGLLITVGEKTVPYVRPIGAFANEGSDIYFVTAKATDKVKQINLNPTVTLYFQNEGQPFDTFKSVAVSGDASEVSLGAEFDKAVEAISVRYPIIKQKISSGEFKSSAIYKVKAKLVKLADYTKNPREVIENIEQ